MTGNGERRPVGLTSLPQEVFDHIVDYLPRWDKATLALVSKNIRTLSERSFYSSIKISDQQDFVGLSRTLASRPYLCKAIRRFSLTGEITFAWWLDPLSSFTGLQEFIFQQVLLAGYDDLTRHTVYALRKIAAGDWIQPALRRCTVSVSYITSTDVPIDVAGQVLSTMMSVAFVESFIFSYSKAALGDPLHLERRQERIPPEPLPALPVSRCTNLRELRLRWDGLPLPWLSSLLRLPRRLEIFHLEISLHHTAQYSDDVAIPPLDTVLKPVADTLRTLSMIPVETSRDVEEEPWEVSMEDVGFRWSPNGLRSFIKLETLAIHVSSFGEFKVIQGIGQVLGLPGSLVTLNLLGVYLCHGWHVDGMHIRLSCSEEMLEELCEVVSTLPRLRYLGIRCHEEFAARYLRHDLPPAYVGKTAESLVSRGLQLAVQTEGGKRVEIGISLDPDEEDEKEEGVVEEIEEPEA